MTYQEDAGLYRLTYISSSPGEMAQPDLDAILEVARENNHRHEVTGLLLYHDMQFFQTLEGKRQDVEQVFARIKADRRHNRWLVLESRSVESRLFDGWSMAYKSIGELNASQKQNFVDLTNVRSHLVPDRTNGNANTGILIDSFLSSFRDLRLR